MIDDVIKYFSLNILYLFKIDRLNHVIFKNRSLQKIVCSVKNIWKGKNKNIRKCESLQPVDNLRKLALKCVYVC